MARESWSRRAVRPRLASAAPARPFFPFRTRASSLLQNLRRSDSEAAPAPTPPRSAAAPTSSNIPCTPHGAALRRRIFVTETSWYSHGVVASLLKCWLGPRPVTSPSLLRPEAGGFALGGHQFYGSGSTRKLPTALARAIHETIRQTKPARVGSERAGVGFVSDEWASFSARIEPLCCMSRVRRASGKST